MMKRVKYQSFTIERKLGIIDEVGYLSLEIRRKIPFRRYFRGRKRSWIA